MLQLIWCYDDPSRVLDDSLVTFTNESWLFHSKETWIDQVVVFVDELIGEAA